MMGAKTDGASWVMTSLGDSTWVVDGRNVDVDEAMLSPRFSGTWSSRASVRDVFKD